MALGFPRPPGLALALVYPGVGDEGPEEDQDRRPPRRWFRALLLGLVLVLVADAAGVLPFSGADESTPTIEPEVLGRVLTTTSTTTTTTTTLAPTTLPARSSTTTTTRPTTTTTEPATTTTEPTTTTVETTTTTLTSTTEITTTTFVSIPTPTSTFPPPPEP